MPQLHRQETSATCESAFCIEIPGLLEKIETWAQASLFAKTAQSWSRLWPMMHLVAACGQRRGKTRPEI
jgi:hypothetical protein